MTREQNHFYTLTPYSSRESVLSISAWDYSSGHVDIAELTSEASKLQKTFVVSSGIWGLKDFEQKCAALQNSNPLCRLQISWGAEFNRHAQKILSFLENAGKLDLLIDRPLDAESVQEIAALCQCHDVRLCLIANRYFNVEETIESLSPSLSPYLILNFLPPADKKSPFYSPDEVIRVLEACTVKGDLKVAIFDNIIESQTDLKDAKFYLQLNREDYFSGSALLEQYKSFRTLVLWMIRKNLVVLLDVLYAALIFLRKPSWQGFVAPFKVAWNAIYYSLLNTGRMIYCSLLNRGRTIYHFFRYKVFHIIRYDLFHFFRYRAFNFVWYGIGNFFRYRAFNLVRYGIGDFVKYKIWHFIRYNVAHFVRYNVFHWFRYTLPDLFRVYVFYFFKYRVPHVFRLYIYTPVMVFCRYRLPHYLKTASMFLFYPLCKIYWFCSFQFQKRVLPHLRRGVREE